MTPMTNPARSIQEVIRENLHNIVQLHISDQEKKARHYYEAMEQAQLALLDAVMDVLEVRMRNDHHFPLDHDEDRQREHSHFYNIGLSDFYSTLRSVREEVTKI